MGDAGSDTIDGGADKDTCYGSGGGGKRTHCEVSTDEVTKEKASKSTSATTPAPSFRRLAATPGLSYWYIGNDDYLFVYSAAATQNIGRYIDNSSRWENAVCVVLRKTPAAGACSATNALQAIEKYQMRWFLWNAKRNLGCAVGIVDRGRHGIFQHKKRWKVRSATYERYNVAITYVTPNRWTDIKTSDPGEVEEPAPFA